VLPCTNTSANYSNSVVTVVPPDPSVHFHHWTWPLRKENEVALQRVEMRMVRWMCGVKLQDRIPGKGLSERLGSDDIISVLLQNGGRPKKTWREIVEKRLSGTWIEQGRCRGSRLMDEADKGRLMTTMGVSG